LGVIRSLLRLNLCIHYLNQGELAKAQDVIKDMKLFCRSLLRFRRSLLRLKDMQLFCGYLLRFSRSLLRLKRDLLNLFYRNQDELTKAQDVIKDMQPNQPEEYILRAVVAAAVGQESTNSELIKEAQQNFQIFGASSTHCDTIPGRQVSFDVYLVSFEA